MKSKKYLFFKIFLTLLYVLPGHAALLGYCFDRSVSLSQVQAHIQTVLSPRDQAFPRASNHCLEINAADTSKSDLYYKWISRNFNIAKTYSEGGGQAETRPAVVNEHCRLQLETVESLSRTDREGSLGTKTRLNQTERTGSKSRKSNILIGVGLSGRIRVDNDELMVSCNSRNSNTVFLDISFYGERSSVSTSVRLSVGSPLNLASVVEDLNDKYRELSLNRGITQKKTTGSKSTQYYLSVTE